MEAMRSPAHGIEPVAGRRRGRSVVLLIVALVFGVVTMHAMSGSPNSHGPMPTFESMAQLVSEPSMTGAHAELMGVDPTLVSIQLPANDANGMHQLMTAMCLLALVALVALAVPLGQSSRWSLLLNSAGQLAPRRWARATSGAPPPSLIALGISRT